MSNFDNILEKFKEKKIHGRVITLLENNTELKALVAAWCPEILKPTPDGTEPPVDENGQWEWLWSQISIDETLLMQRACIDNLRPKMNQAKALRIIFPDGSVDKYTEGFLVLELKKKKN